METRVKVRGIYSTALTSLLLNSGHEIAEPAPEIGKRLGLKENRRGYEVMIRDRGDLQGVELLGATEHICPLLRLLQDRLLDAVLTAFRAPDDPDDLAQAVVEFPGASKATLDRIRASVVPTISRHHRLQIVDPQGLERAERELGRQPARKVLLEQAIYQEAILGPLCKAGTVRLEHVRPSGRTVALREGLLVEGNDDQLVIRRSFSTGRYDGLQMPIERGDYGLTEVREGAWCVKHAYYSKEHELKGVYYNINTPVEFYPHGIRYLDLEVDVVRRSGEEPRTVDADRLLAISREGRIGEGLAKKAVEVAEALKAGSTD